MTTYEHIVWTNTWFEDQGETDLRRALLVGDSITNAARPFVKECVGETLRVDAVTTSRALDDPGYLTELDYVLGLNAYDVIHFNNGLHGFHLSAEDYETLYDGVVAHVLEKCPGTKLVLALTTPVSLGEHRELLDAAVNGAVLARNAAVLRIAGKYGLETDDLYSLVVGIPEIRTADSYHYLEPGSRRIAGQIASYLR